MNTLNQKVLEALGLEVTEANYEATGPAYHGIMNTLGILAKMAYPRADSMDAAVVSLREALDRSQGEVPPKLREALDRDPFGSVITWDFITSAEDLVNAVDGEKPRADTAIVRRAMELVDTVCEVVWGGTMVETALEAVATGIPPVALWDEDGEPLPAA